MAIAEAAAPSKKGPSLVVQGGVVAVLTLAALGGGWFAGNMLGARVTQQSASADPAGGHAAPSGALGDAEGHGAEGEAPVNPLLVPLASMTTNLAAPDTVWVQMELALLLDQPQPPEMIETIHQDLLAYLRTVKLHQIEGASGYRHLKADLEERARIRSDGHVQQVLIRALIFE